MTQQTKPFIVANVREIIDGWEHFDPEGYSFSKMVEKLNEVAEKFYKPKTDNMTQQTMTKEQILESRISCTCNEAYKTRQMADPDCGRCNWHEEILSCMEEYAQQEVAKEREKAKKLVKVLTDLIDRLDFSHPGQRDSIYLIKQSLTEYEKL